MKMMLRLVVQENVSSARQDLRMCVSRVLMACGMKLTQSGRKITDVPLQVSRC